MGAAGADVVALLPVPLDDAAAAVRRISSLLPLIAGSAADAGGPDDVGSLQELDP